MKTENASEGANTRKYKFSADLLGDEYNSARPRLGPTAPLAVYRLFQFTLRDVLEQRYGTEQTDELFRQAGVLAGRTFYDKYCTGAATASELARIIQDQFKALSIGIVRFEKSDPENLDFQLTVDEDLDCSGLPDTNDQICAYDEGFIKGILDSFTGKEFSVREVDCWCSGERTCRFRARLAGAEAE